MKYSERLGEIKDEQFQKALDRFNLGKFIKAESIPYGNFGQNLFLTSSKGEFVLRGKSHYSWQFKSEKFFAHLIHSKTSVLIPWPYLLDEKTDIFGWSYVIMPKLKGVHLADEKFRNSLDPKIRIQICKSVAQNLAEIHKIKWKFAGSYDEKPGTISPLATSFGESIVKRILDHLKKAQSYNNYTTQEDVEWVEQILSENKEALTEEFTPTIVFQDYREGNMIADKVKGKWQITGIFDLMELYMGDSEISLSRSFAGYKEENEDLAYVFLNEYFSHTPKRKGFKRRFLIYMLLDRSIIWEWRQRKGNMWWKKDLTFKEWCEPYTHIDIISK